jgi:hypothetical protein
MTLRALAAAALFASAAIPAFAEPNAAPAAQAMPAGHDADASTRRICRVTPTIGSRLGGTRTCRTKAEWDAADRENRDVVNRIQRGTPACMMGPNEPGHAGLVCSN